MNFIQNLVSKMRARSKALRAAMEAESRTWMIRCPRCGYEQSVWDSGGVMYKAYGTSWQYRQCPHCGKRAWNKVYRQKPPQPKASK